MLSMQTYAGTPGSHVPERREMPDLYTASKNYWRVGREETPVSTEI